MGSTIDRGTLSEYGIEYQLRQAAKYRDREHNHWRQRIDLAHRLVDEHALPRLAGRAPGEITVVDVGCSMGTFAIEFAKRGFRAVGIDFDETAIEVARGLAAEEGVAPEFLVGDVADMAGAVGRAEIAVCFDIFEHLQDDELGVLLRDVRRLLSPDGAMVFHTFPTEFDYLFFWDYEPNREALRRFIDLDPERFEREVRAYAAEVDAKLIRARGVSHRERITGTQHCNPTTQSRLGAILGRAGWEVLTIDTAQLYPYGREIIEQFGNHRALDRNLFGVAVPRP